MSEEIKGKLVAKAGNGKGFKIEGEESWFNAVEGVIPFLAKIEKGETVTVTYNKKGAARFAVKIFKDTGAPTTTKSTASKEESTTGFKCSECGVALKDDTYPTCYPCSQNSNKKEKEKVTDSKYRNPEITASIQRGNSLNAAAAVLSGTDLVKTADAETIAELVKVVAGLLLDWLRAE